MKPIISESEFRRQIERAPSGGFLFFGDEDYLKAHALKLARERVCPDPALAVFNDMTVDFSLSGFSPDALASALAASPMMADGKLVTVPSININDLRQSELDALCEAIAAIDEFDFNTLIISVPSGMMDEGYLPKRPSAALSKLGERLTPVHFEKVTDAKLSSWIVRHFDHNGLRVESGVPAAMLAKCGRDMFTLTNEIDKLSFYVLAHERNAVAIADVEEVTSASEDFDSFALGSAVTDGNSELALRILGVMKARKTEPVIILGELSRTFSDMLGVKLLTEAGYPPADIAASLSSGSSKLSEYRVKLYQKSVKNMSAHRLRRAVEAAAAADLALKLSMSNGYIEIEKLIIEAI